MCKSDAAQSQHLLPIGENADAVKLSSGKTVELPNHDCLDRPSKMDF